MLGDVYVEFNFFGFLNVFPQVLNMSWWCSQHVLQVPNVFPKMFPITFYPIFLSWAKWKHLHILKTFCDGSLKVAPYHTQKNKKPKKIMGAFYPQLTIGTTNNRKVLERMNSLKSFKFQYLLYTWYDWNHCTINQFNIYETFAMAIAHL